MCLCIHTRFSKYHTTRKLSSLHTNHLRIIFFYSIKTIFIWFFFLRFLLHRFWFPRYFLFIIFLFFI
ncbi:cell division protein SepF [Listeria monocytogenes]|nr:cell division protein SepF [Listeria monocytogenes]